MTTLPSLLASAAVWFLIMTYYCGNVSAHGYLKTPRSRNLVAFEDLNWETYLGGTGGANDPLPEDCPHCLNRGGTLAQCGIASDIRNYDLPLNVRAQPLSPNVQSEYGEGDVIEVEVLVTTHHKGHFEFRTCPISTDSLPMEVPTAECFAKNKLQFVSDELYHAPIDMNYPERAYLIPASRAVFTQDDFYGAQYKMKFKLPEGVYGDVVLLQWYYLTANSCKHVGYTDMVFPDTWGPDAKLYSEVPDCVDIPDDGNGVPEQFWNCAEIKIARRSDDSTNENSSPTNDNVGPEQVTLVEAPITTPNPTEAGVTLNPTEAEATTPIPTDIPMTFPTLSPSSLLEEVPVTDVSALKLTTFDDVLEQNELSVKADASHQSQLRPPKPLKVVYDRWNYDGGIEYVKETYELTASPTIDQVVTTFSPTVKTTEMLETSIPTLSSSVETVETEDPTSLLTASSSVLMKTPEPSKSSFSEGNSYASSFASSIHDKTSDQASLAMMFASKPMDEDEDDTSEHPTSLPTLEPAEDREDYIIIETSPSVVEYGGNHRPTKQKGKEHHQQLVNSITNQIQQHLVKQKAKRARQKTKTKISKRTGKRRKREAV